VFLAPVCFSVFSGDGGPLQMNIETRRQCDLMQRGCRWFRVLCTECIACHCALRFPGGVQRWSRSKTVPSDERAFSLGFVVRYLCQ
jgi:hypothetical protein